MVENRRLSIKRTQKAIRFSPKLIVIYVLVFVFLIMMLKTMIKTPTKSEERLLRRLSKNPENVQLNFDVAEYYFLNEDYFRAIRYYKSGLALSDDENLNMHYKYKLGLSYLNSDKSEAVEYLENVYKSGYKESGLEESLALSYKCKGNFYLKNLKAGHFGNYSKSRLRQLVKLYFVRAYEVYSEHFLQSEEHADDIKYIEMRLLEIDPKFKLYFSFKSDSEYSKLEGLLFVGILYKDIREFEKSKQVLLKLLSKEEVSSKMKYESLMVMGWMSFDEKQYSKALKYYKSAKKSLNTAKVNFWLGKTYEQLDMKKEALKHIKISLKMDPKYPSALKKLKELQQ